MNAKWIDDHRASVAALCFAMTGAIMWSWYGAMHRDVVSERFNPDAAIEKRLPDFYPLKISRRPELVAEFGHLLLDSDHRSHVQFRSKSESWAPVRHTYEASSPSADEGSVTIDIATLEDDGLSSHALHVILRGLRSSQPSAEASGAFNFDIGNSPLIIESGSVQYFQDSKSVQNFQGSGKLSALLVKVSVEVVAPGGYFRAPIDSWIILPGLD